MTCQANADAFAEHDRIVEQEGLKADDGYELEKLEYRRSVRTDARP